MVIEPVLKEFRVGLEKLYGQRLIDMLLYGSWARNEATEDSDIDLAVILKGKVSKGGEIDRMIDLITELNLKFNVLLSVYPVSQNDYKKLTTPLLINMRKEGIHA
ncbi:MAG: nucleotidyltransferase domain-containing protein [Planctomycetota bacterium]